MRKVHVTVTVKLVINANEGQDITSVLEDMDYSFTAQPTSNADIEDTEILDWEVTDSR
jgi:hypothetical protein